MRRALVVVLMLGLSAGCMGREAGAKVDVIVRRAIQLGNSANAEAGVLYWGARTRISDDPHKRLIFDLDAKTVTFIDKQKRTYIVRTLDEVVRKYEKRREQREPAAAKIALVRTANTERIAGYDAREYTFTTPRTRGAVWVTEDVRPPGAWRKLESLISFLEGGFAGGDSVSEAVADVDGYPLRTAFTFGEGATAWTITMQVEEITSGKPTDDLAGIPADFQRANDFPMPGES